MFEERALRMGVRAASADIEVAKNPAPRPIVPPGFRNVKKISMMIAPHSREQGISQVPAGAGW